MSFGRNWTNSLDSPALTKEKVLKLIDWLESEKVRMEKEKQTFVIVDLIALNYKRIRTKIFIM